MSQNSLTLPTTGTVSGLQMTQNTNNALDTLNTLASGASVPASPEAGQLWHDTTNNLLKIRSLDNTTWISLFQVNEAAYAAATALTPTGTNDRLNRLVNGGMMVDQANEGASYTIPTSNTFTYTLDQWEVICKSSTASGVTVQQVSDAPAGFVNSLKLTVGTGAGSVGSIDNLQIIQPIEGANLSDLGFGSAAAVPISISFWVKSSITGTFSVVLSNSGGARTYITTFAISSAGVWQKITLANIPGDQSGTWPTNNTQALSIGIVQAVGTGDQTTTLNAWQAGAFIGANTQTNSVLTTSGATFQITGVQLNSGAFAQAFDKRTVQQELALCERYYEKTFPQGVAVAQNGGTTGAIYYLMSTATGSFGINSAFRVPKRTSATMTTYNPAAANANWFDFSNSVSRTASVSNPSDKTSSIAGTGGAAGSVNGIHYTANARM